MAPRPDVGFGILFLESGSNCVDVRLCRLLRNTRLESTDERSTGDFHGYS